MSRDDSVPLARLDYFWGHGYERGAMSVGVVSSTDSFKVGFAPDFLLMAASPASETLTS